MSKTFINVKKDFYWKKIIIKIASQFPKKKKKPHRPQSFECHVHMKMYLDLCICLCICLSDVCYSPLREREEDKEMADFLQTNIPNRCSMKSMCVLLWCCELKAKLLNLRFSALNAQINITIHFLSISVIVLLTACSSLMKMQTGEINKEYLLLEAWMLILFSGC